MSVSGDLSLKGSNGMPAPAARAARTTANPVVRPKNQNDVDFEKIEKPLETVVTAIGDALPMISMTRLTLGAIRKRQVSHLEMTKLILKANNSHLKWEFDYEPLEAVRVTDYLSNRESRRLSSFS